MNDRNTVPVYEFSKGFQNPHYSQNYGRWLSEGYSKPIERENFPVPQPIREAVINGDFAINDNYSPDPESGEFALIARDVGQYSVLAVATGEIDYAKGPTIAYRYFWLERCQVEETELDGIGTLLVWWYRVGQPRYHFDEKQNVPSDRQRYPAKHYIPQDFEDDFSEEAKIFSQITHIPDAYLAQKNNDGIYPQPREWHSLVRKLQAKYQFKERGQAPISWAWNVRWLEKPERFALILSADKPAHQENLNGLQKSRQKLLETIYEFSESTYWGEREKEVTVTILRHNPLPKTEKVTLLLDGQPQQLIDFAPNQERSQVKIPVDDRESKISLGLPEGGKLGERREATIKLKPFFEFSKKSYYGEIGKDIQVGIERKGDPSKEVTINLLMDEGLVKSINFTANELFKQEWIQIPDRRGSLRLEARNPANLGKCHTANIIPNPIFEFSENLYYELEDRQATTFTILRKGDSTESATIEVLYDEQLWDTVKLPANQSKVDQYIDKMSSRRHKIQLCNPSLGKLGKRCEATIIPETIPIAQKVQGINNFFNCHFTVNNNNLENNPNKPQQKLNLARTLEQEFHDYGKSGSEEDKKEIIDLLEKINKYYFEGNTNNNEPSDTVKKARNFISNSLTIQSLLKEDKVSFPINNDSEKATKKQLQLMLYGLGFYETKNDRAKFNQREFRQIVDGNLGDSTAKALNKFTEKYTQSSQIFPEGKEQPNLESVNVEVNEETWKLLHKLYLEEPVKVATNLLLNSFQLKTDSNEIIKDINQLISCREEASSRENTSEMYISYLNCVAKLMNTDNQAQAGN